MCQDKIITVFGGTPIDTRLGAKLVQNNGLRPIQIAMAQSPDEQSKLQYYEKGRLEREFEKKAKETIDQGAKKILIYCNSLSSVINYETIGEKLDIEIISPLDVYKDLEGYKNIAILTANGVSAYRIEHIINKYSGIRTITFGNMNLVNSIENKEDPQEIIKKLALDKLILYLESIEAPFRIDGILLGCTHFPYIKEQLEKLTSIKIINPDDQMIERLKNG